MPPVLIGAGFVGGLVLSLGSSEVMARGLTRLGTKLHLSEGLLGLLGALGADTPELSSAVIAIAAGAPAVGTGVIVGSNLFNLAALLGLSGLVVGGINIRRAPLLLDAIVGMTILLPALALVAGVTPAWAAGAVTVAIGGLYTLLLARPQALGHRFRRLVPALPHDVSEVEYEPAHDRPLASRASWAPVWLLPLAVGGVLLGSFMMVHEALAAAPALHLSSVVLGTLLLAALTSLPNVWVALHFARAGRGTALFSAAMNSNSINLVGGLIVPALISGSAAARSGGPAMGVLVALTALASLVSAHRGRLGRLAGGAIIAPYLLFAALTVACG